MINIVTTTPRKNKLLLKFGVMSVENFLCHIILVQSWKMYDDLWVVFDVG